MGEYQTRSGQDLAGDVDECRPAPGQCALWWLGQHSFILKLGGAVLYLDPFLTDLPGRRFPSPIRAGDMANAALIFGSHDHADHIDRPVWPAIARTAPRAQFVVPDLLREGLARDLGLAAARLVGLDDGVTVRVGGIEITGVAAAHEFLDPDPATGRHPHLGFVVRANGCSVYHSGDCCVYEGLQTRLKSLRPDVMLLPINGRDARRLKAGCIGNMTYQEAADLAGAVAPALAIPAHFDMFEGNTEDPRLFADYMAVKYPRLRTIVPEHGRRILWP